MRIRKKRPVRKMPIRFSNVRVHRPGTVRLGDTGMNRQLAYRLVDTDKGRGDFKAT